MHFSDYLTKTSHNSREISAITTKECFPIFKEDFANEFFLDNSAYIRPT